LRRTCLKNTGNSLIDSLKILLRRGML